MSGFWFNKVAEAGIGKLAKQTVLQKNLRDNLSLNVGESALNAVVFKAKFFVVQPQ